MKKIFTILVIIFTTINIQAQSPQQFKYQAALRDTEGNIISNQEVTIIIDILQGSAEGTSVFTETHTVNTTVNGLIGLNIGSVNTLNLDWQSNTHYLQITVNGSVMGTSQLLSVPYALHANTTDTFTGNITEDQISNLGNYLTTETDPNFSSWDKSSGIEITKSQISDLGNYLTTESDPNFAAWNKSTGIQITESQITDLKTYLTSIENQSIANLSDIDLTGVEHNNVLKYDAAISKFVVAEAFGTTETDPVFNAWDKSSGITITESQISDLGTYLSTESDPNFTAWDRSSGISITESQISDFGAYLTSESDPVFSAWDKSSGITITESQISDLQTYLTSESDPEFSSSAANNIMDAGSGLVITSKERVKLTNIEDGANINIQADWNQTNSSSDAYINNKPIAIHDFTLDADAQNITNLANPVNAQDAATKAYVDANSGGGSGVTDGINTGDLLYWDGSQWDLVSAGSNGQVLTMNGGQPQWVSTSQGTAIIVINSISSLTNTTSNINSEVLSEGGNAVTERGIVWDTNPSVNINDDNTITRGVGSGSFLTEMENLESNTKHYARAYASNSAGTSYSDENNFVTLASLTTTTASGRTSSSFNSGGVIDVGGNEEVTERGIVYSSSAEPTTSDQKVIDDDTGTGSFSVTITGLTTGTYYYRSYAINSGGVNYGEEHTVYIDGPGSGMTDTEGNTYETVLIGGQEWMAENLKYLPSVVGEDTYADDQIYYYVYGYNGTDVTAAKATANYSTYGVLYNWNAAQNACPDGWHLPSNAEWQQLVDYVGTNSRTKLNSTSGWTNGINGTDNYGFTILPGGSHIGSFGFYLIGETASFWSSDVTTPFWMVSSNDTELFQGNQSRHAGTSVRCVKD